MEFKTIHIVDDDPMSLKIAQKLFSELGWTVRASSSSLKGFEEIVRAKPDCVLLDIMMPEMDGLELCRKLREQEGLEDLQIMIASVKHYQSDKTKALRFGADGYIVKPISREKIEEAFHAFQHISLRFWGCRGTFPVPGKRSLKYGGNTSCVSIKLSNDRWFILDAGTGFKELSNYLIQSKQTRIKANLFITHPHWDHINAFPFFNLLYIPGNDISVYGPSQGGGHSIKKTMLDQMDGIYFPVTSREFAARVEFQDLAEGTYEIDGVEVQTMLLTHPGNCLGYRLNFKGRSICYITDNELFPEGVEFADSAFWDKLSAFIAGAEVLIHDTAYFDSEYKNKIGWGHSCLSEVAKLAHVSKVKRLYLHHHDPAHSDDDIGRKIELAKEILSELKSSTEVCAAVEQEEILV